MAHPIVISISHESAALIRYACKEMQSRRYEQAIDRKEPEIRKDGDAFGRLADLLSKAISTGKAED